MKEITRLTSDDFINQNLPEYLNKVLVFFSADWCPYCITFFNNWKEYGKVENVLIADVTNVDSRLWNDFQLEIVPSMGVFVGGELKKWWNGILMKGLTINHIEEVNSYFNNI